MSQENVAIVRGLYSRWERGDFGSVEWAHPEIEWVIADGPSAGSWTSVAGSYWDRERALDAAGLRE